MTDLKGSIYQYLGFQFTWDRHLIVQAYAFKSKDSNRATTKFPMVSMAAIFQHGDQNRNILLCWLPIRL